MANARIKRDIDERLADRIQETKDRIESYFAKKEFNNFNTVDDLFKQLEPK